MKRQCGFTILELLIAVVIVAIVLTIAIPSFSQIILRQRLKSINAQLVTDLQLARSETVTRRTIGRVVFGSNASMTCYTIYALVPFSPKGPVTCDCTAGPGSACDPTAAIEIRTVQVPTSLGVMIVTATTSDVPPRVGFDTVNGGLVTLPTDSAVQPAQPFQIDTQLDSAHLIRTILGSSGRPQVCSLGDAYGPPPC